MSVIFGARPRIGIPTSGVLTGITTDYLGTGITGVYDVAHGLVTGQFIYISNTPEEYLGFWEVLKLTDDDFAIRRDKATPQLKFYRAYVSINYQICGFQAVWNSVNLPIVYKLVTNRYPNNESDTERVITSFADDEGLTRLVLNGNIRVTTLYPKDQIRILDADDTRLNGVWRVVNVMTNSQFTIDLPYEDDFSNDNAKVQYYYTNFHLVARVIAGVPDNHPWEFINPWAERAFLKMVPDSENKVLFSVSDIMKSQIQVINNSNTVTLPNSLTSWTSFYLEIAEAYDQISSDGTVNVETTEFTSELTQNLYNKGYQYAVNSSREFKSLYAGFMDDYMYGSRYWLTAMQAFRYVGKYFDLSVLVNLIGSLTLQRKNYRNGLLRSTDVTTYNIDENGDGLWRLPVELNCDDDYSDVSLLYTQDVPPLIEWIYQYDDSGTSQAWTLGTTPTLDYTISNQSKWLQTDFDIRNGGSYTVKLSINKVVGGNAAVDVRLFNGTTQVSFGSPQSLLGPAGLYERTITRVATGPGTLLSIQINNSNGGAETFQLLSVEVLAATPIEAVANRRFNIDCGCTKYSIYLGWLNNLGGFDYWNFEGGKDYQIEIDSMETVKNNILPQWPHSYGQQADTINKQTKRVSRRQYIVRSQNLTRAEVDAISMIKTSILVQIIYSKADKRTVLVDAQSFKVYAEVDKLYTLSFTITFTDDLPVQSL